MTYTAPSVNALQHASGTPNELMGIEFGKIDTEIDSLSANYKSGAAANKNDGDTITHGLGTTPTAVLITGSVSGEMVSVTTIGATTFTIAIKTPLQAAGTQQTVYWMAIS